MDMPLPPDTLRERVAGTKDALHFNASGGVTVDEWSRALACVGKTFGDFTTIVDFGCGCGRAIRHLRGKMNLNVQKLIGLDPDREAISWLNQSLAGVRAFQLNDLPPTPLADASADLVVSHSVFTHLPEDVQYAWLAELARILKPGGIVITTIHGAEAFAGFCADLRRLGHADLVENLSGTMQTSGFLYLKGRTAAEEALPEYYGSAFHNIAYVSKEWPRFFKILAWLPQFALEVQDTLVLRKL